MLYETVFRCRCQLLVLAFCWLSFHSQTVIAQTPAEPPVTEPWPAEPPGSSPIQVDLRVDLPIMAATGVLGASLHFMQDELVHARCSPHCDAGPVNALDRTVVGQYSAAASTAGDVLVGLNFAVPCVLGAIDMWLGDRPDGWLGYGKDLLILAQTVTINIGVHQITVFASQRPRPYVYNQSVSNEMRADANSYLSFYSGHTANAFGVATAYSYLFTLRHPRSPWVVPVWLTTHGLAGLGGYLRVTSGYHYWTDVLVGAVIGSSIGLIVPFLHQQRTDTDADAEQQQRSSAAAGFGPRNWLVAPLAQSGTLGVSLIGW